MEIAPFGPGAFGDWSDTSIAFIGGAVGTSENGDGTNALNTRCFFYGSVTRNIAFNHSNYGATSTCSLIAETDINYPSYTLKLITGNISASGVSVVERY